MMFKKVSDSSIKHRAFPEDIKMDTNSGLEVLKLLIKDALCCGVGIWEICMKPSCST